MPRFPLITGSSEDAEDLGRFVAGAAEPVRHLGVELRDLARPEHPVLIAENETEPAGQHVDPFVPVVGARLGVDLARRDHDLPRLHAGWCTRSTKPSEPSS